MQHRKQYQRLAYVFGFQASVENPSRRRSVRLSVAHPTTSEFKNPFEVTSNWKVENQQRHNNNILSLLNSANLNMLKSLPAIGPKTAFVLINHRYDRVAFDFVNLVIQFFFIQLKFKSLIYKPPQKLEWKVMKPDKRLSWPSEF